VSWVSTDADDVLSLQPRTYDLWRLTLREATRVADARLLELCRTSMAQTYERTAPGGAAEPADDREQAALAYVEQLMIDQNGITEEQKEHLGRHMTHEQLSDFTFAAYTHDADLRARTLLGIEAAPPPFEGDMPNDDVGVLFPFPGVDPAYSEALGRFGNEACAQSLVDPTTSEVCRLRNATHQQCHF
jgi:hypothetical protein